METSPEPLLKPVIDAYSYQVHAPSDPGFWFRLVREPDRDVITDYRIGSFPREQGGALLSACRRLLRVTPGRVILFADIFCGIDPNEETARNEARGFYSACGRSLLADFGIRLSDEYIEKALGKWHLRLVAQSDGSGLM
jgi:hypothetical protein